MSCADCGAVNTAETFTHGEAKPHNFVENTDEKYLKSEATCTEKAVYYMSCADCEAVNNEATFEFGSVLDHKHGEWTPFDKDQHKRSCECGDTEYAEHAFDANGICTECKFSRAIPGDLNGDESVDIRDAEYLLMHSFYPDFFPVDQSVDFDGNGSVDIRDAEYLLMYSFYPDFVPLG